MSWPWVSLTDATPYQILMDFTGSPGGGPVYIGWATPGVLTSDSKWKIIKITYSLITIDSQPVYVETRRQFANGDVGFRHVFSSTGGTVYDGKYLFK